MSKRQNDDEYVYLTSAAGLPEANLLRSLLEANGIPVLFVGESAGPAYGFTVGTLGRVDLWVPRERQAEAAGLVESMESPAPGEPASDEPPAETT
jgi:Putative prokaryotic signal transducing protein